MPSVHLTRYAPSPTGYIHLGHVAHMLYVWGTARACGANVLLRIEDHDRGRCRPEFEQALFEDIAWLGLSTINTVETASPYRQSDCDDRYNAALEQLRQSAEVYACTCTRRELTSRTAPTADGERPYDGLCRTAGHDAERAAARLHLASGSEGFVDGLLGEHHQDPSLQCGDLVLRDRTQQWTYQFAVTVDDLTHGIDLIVRGEDLLASTGRQIRLARLLGRQQSPLFLHHPLIRDGVGAKLSKNTASSPIREMRLEGQGIGAVFGSAAYAVGLTPTDGPHELDDLLDRVAAEVHAKAAWVAKD
jgi:glutamyl-Q tRNA(Asp) synthetase